MNVLRIHQFEQAGAAMRAAETAVLYAAPGRLRDGVRVENFIDSNRPGVNPFGWFDNSLNNAGERISLFDRYDNLISSVDYADGGGWPTAARRSSSACGCGRG